MSKQPLSEQLDEMIDEVMKKYPPGSDEYNSPKVQEKLQQLFKARYPGQVIGNIIVPDEPEGTGTGEPGQGEP